ncbi:MAG: hypothetical protein E7626_00320 [Ruminococcaceae bacterium]|nr:hypothetical protein [Oscillospiraceae bacterium]
MKKILSLLLALCMASCLFSCKKDESDEKGAFQTYCDAVALTRDLSYQKFELSRSVTADGVNYNEPYYVFCKLIRKDGKTSFYSERTLKVETQAGITESVLYHHYENGVMYQTLEKSKMKHTLSQEAFEKQYPTLQGIILSLPSVSGEKIADNSDGGSDFVLSLDVSKLEKSEQDKLYSIFELYSSHALEAGYTIGGNVDISFSTDFDGYFVKYALSFNVSGTENGEQKDLKMTLSLDVFNPGSHFSMVDLPNTSGYVEGTMNIK